MTREWFAECKDCGVAFGYSDSSQQISGARGLSRPERCPACRRLHSREISSLGLSHFEVMPISPIPAEGLRPAELGGLIRPKRVHELKEQEPRFDLNKFGIKDSHMREFCALSQRHQVMVVVAPTGSGKSTFFPYRLMVPPEGLPDEPFRSMLPAGGIAPDLFTRNGQIIVTQPRIQATRNIPAFVARDLHGSSLGAGFDVGFQHSGNPATDWRNKLVYMTDGTLINMIVRNEIGRLSVILIDEAHERSLNIDLILGLLKAQLGRYPHLRLIIASATIDTRLFLRYYGGRSDFDPDRYKTISEDGDIYDNAAIAQALAGSPIGFYGFPGKRQYPVETRFREDNPLPVEQWSGRMPDEVAQKVVEVLKGIHARTEAQGDILAFLHGKKPIERAVVRIRDLLEEEADPRLAAKVDVLPLYTELPQSQQDAALKPKKDSSRIRVVVSTNVAETSLTVDGIVHVVESGLINESQWDPQTQTTYVLPKIHSQSGCKQRWGRGGRVQAGVAHCLYTEEQFAAFPAHTDPEIMRAPLEQIVLTAKAAGVSDLKAFDWIQRPSEAELERAPQFLKDIGALDNDGDLTDHGIELRNFAEETDIANLIILADRFGCAVEMATLLPMRKLGGYSSLLTWDRGWDAPTKLAVRRIHQGLIGPCRDDLEFCLKLWEAWEGSAFGRSSDAEREAWSQRYFVRHSVFKKQIAEERAALLQSLSAHKKDDRARPIDFNLLTRLRIVMTFGLSNQIYRLVSPAPNGSEFSEAPSYQPFIRDPEANQELVRLHEGAVVEISPESICFRQPLELFICGKRQRTRKRESPLVEPITFISAAFLTLIKPSWLQCIGQSHIAIARLIAAETRDAQGVLRATTTRARLFIDQAYPIGATFACTNLPDGSVQIGPRQANPPRLRTGRSYEDIEAPEEIEVLESEGALSEALGSDEVTLAFAPQEEPPVVDFAMSDEDAEAEAAAPGTSTAVVSATPARTNADWDLAFPGRLLRSSGRPAIGGRFNGVVVGYDFTDRSQVTVLLDVPITPSPFEQFTKVYRYQEGSDIEVAVEAIEEYVNDGLLYLIVRETKSNLEIILDPYDASLGGRNFAIDLLRQSPPGTSFMVTVEDINEQAQRVRATRLKAAQAATAAFLGDKRERIVDAQVVEVRDNGLYLWLDPASTKDYLPVTAFVHLDRLPQRPSEMSLGKLCRVRVQARKFKKPLQLAVALDAAGPKEREVIKRRLGQNWQEDGSLLISDKPLLYGRRLNMLALWDDGNYRRKVNLLFRRSNELDARVIDMTGIENLRTYQVQNRPLRAEVVTIQDDRLVVKTEDGFESQIPKRQVVYDQSRDLHEEVQVNQQVDVYVKQIDSEQGKATLSLLDPTKHPLQAFLELIGHVVEGVVVKTLPHQALVELAPGATGSVHISELSWSRVEQVTDRVTEGQHVRVLILSVDVGNGRAELTMRLPDNDPMRKYAVDQHVTGKVVGFMNNGFGAFVQLEPGAEGYLPRDEIAITPVSDARQALMEGATVRCRIVELDRSERRMRLTIRGAFEQSIFIPMSHRGFVIGKGGSVIHEIMRVTGTFLRLEDDGYCIIQAPDETAVRRGEQRIRKILETQIITFTLDERQPGMLIGTGGSTIQRIIRTTGAQIDVNGQQVTITAANNEILTRTLDELRVAITYSRMIIQVVPSLASRVIGSGGETIKMIRAQSGVHRIDLEKDGSNRFTGRITLEASSRSAVEWARQLIEQHTGPSTFVSVVDGTLPPITHVRPDAPPPRRQQTRHSDSSLPSRDSAPVKNIPPAIVKPATPPPPPEPKVASFTREVRVDPLHIAKLTRKQGGFFASLFGAGKSPIQKVQEATKTEIEVNTITGVLKVTGAVKSAVEQAAQMLLEVVG